MKLNKQQLLMYVSLLSWVVYREGNSSHSNILRNLHHTLACSCTCGNHACESDVQVLWYNVHICSNSLSQILNYGNSRWKGPAGVVGYFSKNPSRHYWWRCDPLGRFLRALRVRWRKNAIWKNCVFGQQILVLNLVF